MSFAFDLEGTSFLPAESGAGDATAADPAVGQKRLLPDGGDTVTDQKRLRTSLKSTFQIEHRGEKRPRTDDEGTSEPMGGDTVTDQNRLRTRLASTDQIGRRGGKRPRTEDEGQEDQMDDTRSVSGITTKTNTSGDSGSDLVPGSHGYGKVAVCAYCNKRSDSPSPLHGSSSDDMYGGFLCWHSYKKYQEGMGHDPTPFKKPNGERCGICGLSYSASGMAAQYGKIKDYKKNVIEQKHRRTVSYPQAIPEDAYNLDTAI